MKSSRSRVKDAVDRLLARGLAAPNESSTSRVPSPTPLPAQARPPRFQRRRLSEHVARRQLAEAFFQHRFSTIALEERRGLALRLLHAIPQLSCPTPQGAFYLLPDVSAYFGRDC